MEGGAWWWRCAWTHHLYWCNDCYDGRHQVLAHFDSVETRPPFDVLDSAGYQAWRQSLDSSAVLRSPTSPLHPYAPGSLSSPYSPRPPPAASSSSSSSSEARSFTTGKRKRDSREEGLEEGEIREEGLPAATTATEEEEEEEQRQSKRGRHEKEDDDDDDDEDEARQNGGQPASSCLLQ
jgi:hypothetical protein